MPSIGQCLGIFLFSLPIDRRCGFFTLIAISLIKLSIRYQVVHSGIMITLPSTTCAIESVIIRSLASCGFTFLGEIFQLQNSANRPAYRPAERAFLPESALESPHSPL